MRRLVWILVVLLVLLVAADRLAWKLAEGEIASRIQSSEHLAAKPDVSIHGFPFLNQVFAGRYTGVDAALDDLTVERGARVDHLQVHLTGLHVPFSALTKRSLNSIPVDAATATGRVSYSSLDAAAKAQLSTDALTVQFAQGKGGELAFTGTYAAGGAQVQLSGDAQITARNGKLLVSIPPDSLDVPDAVRSEVAQLLGTSYRLPALPLGLNSGVAVTARGSHLVIGAGGLG